MKTKLLELFNIIPFFLVTENKAIKMNWARIIEGIVIAGVAALLSAYMTVGELKVRFSYLEVTNQELKVQVGKIGDKLDTMQNKVTTIDILQQERILRERARSIK